ncbi:MAG: hypothetical protein ABIN69_12690 [Aestuariivirga sp.]
MVEKQLKAPRLKHSPQEKNPQGKPLGNAVDGSEDLIAVDRPGFDLGGSTGKTSAGTGLGLGSGSAENRRDRSLPGRRPLRGPQNT